MTTLTKTTCAMTFMSATDLLHPLGSLALAWRATGCSNPASVLPATLRHEKAPCRSAHRQPREAGCQSAKHVAGVMHAKIQTTEPDREYDRAAQDPGNALHGG